MDNASPSHEADNRDAASDPVDRLGLFCMTNDAETLAGNLARSALIASGRVPLHLERSAPAAARAINDALRRIDRDYVAICHQDVFLPDDWADLFDRAIRAVEARDPDWAVIGAVGRLPDGAIAGQVWSSGIGRTVGSRPAAPRECYCFDELLLIVRRGAVEADEHLPGFHLYGTDIPLIAAARGLRCYVADLPVIHNDRFHARLGADYARAHGFMRRKWRHALPIETLIVPITRTGLALRVRQFRMYLSQGKWRAVASDPAADPRNYLLFLDAQPDG